jgi:hypothetical protein
MSTATKDDGSMSTTTTPGRPQRRAKLAVRGIKVTTLLPPDDSPNSTYTYVFRKG